MKAVDQLPTHAHWVTTFWARALAQLSAQATCGQETVSISDILIEFLNANKVAIEHTTRAGWEYDRHLWTDLSDRLKRREPDVEVHKTFRKLDHTHVTAAVQKVATQTQAKQTPRQSDSARPAKIPKQLKAAGGKGSKYGGGKADASGWGTSKGANQFWGTNDSWGSGGSASWEGKGGGKPWGKHGKFNYSNKGAG